MQQQKNKLINHLLKFELYFNEVEQDINNLTNNTKDCHKRSQLSFVNDIIKRNIQSIKKQINKL